MAADEVGTLYLLHFSEPLGDPSRPHMSASHYLGWTNGVTVDKRLYQHRTGYGASITKAARRAGIELILARTWVGKTRTDERRAKSNGHYADKCPICKAERSSV